MDACLPILRNLGWALSVGPGHVLARQGDRPECTYYVLSGELRAIRRQAGGDGLVIGEIGPGDWACEIAGLLGGGEATADVVARGAAELIEVSSARLREFIESHPRDACTILGSVAVGVARRLDEPAARASANAMLALAQDLARALLEQNRRREGEMSARD